MYHFVAIGELKLELESGNAQIRAKFVFTYVTLTFDLDLFMDNTLVDGNNFWKFHDDATMGT